MDFPATRTTRRLRRGLPLAAAIALVTGCEVDLGSGPEFEFDSVTYFYGSIEGVVERDDGTRVAGVEVEVWKRQSQPLSFFSLGARTRVARTSTDDHGRFAFESVQAGPADLEFSSIDGYHPRRLPRVNVPKDGTVRETLVLDRWDQELDVATSLVRDHPHEHLRISVTLTNRAEDPVELIRAKPKIRIRDEAGTADVNVDLPPEGTSWLQRAEIAPRETRTWEVELAIGLPSSEGPPSIPPGTIVIDVDAQIAQGPEDFWGRRLRKTVTIEVQ